MVRLARNKPATPGLADKLPIARGNLAADGDDVRTAFDGHAFERVVIHIHSLGFCGDSTLISRVVNDEVGITAKLNRAFAREQTEDLCGLSAGSIHESVQVETVTLYAISVEGIHAVFERGDAVRNFSEILFSHSLLGGEIERSVVGSQGADKAAAKTAP